MGKKSLNNVDELERQDFIPYHFTFRLCGEEHREHVRAIMREYGITWREIPPNKFFCIGDPKYMLDMRLHEFGMSQDWVDIV